MPRFLPATSLALLLALGCGGDDDLPALDDGGTTPADAGTTEDAATTPDAGSLPTEIGGDRPANVVLPRDYDGTPRPLVILLHGYGASGSAQDLYLGLSRTARPRGVITVIPDGTQNTGGQRFWNATDACCLFGATPVDDVAYITGLVDEAIATYAVDEDRVYLFGHSNGGFMSHRLACDAPERFAAIITLAGTTFSDESRCTPSRPMSLLHIHGTADETIAYPGGAISGITYPGAVETAARLGARAGCDTEPTEGERFDFASDAVSQETIHGNCDEGYDVRLWTLEDGTHIPGWGSGSMDRALDWLLAQSR
ncbi:MAG: alpha/beta fold hydrolase [Sandaracinus sp.]|nr:alpha/beta fold hydrolase [Sandaracinus sp.]